MEKTNIVSAAAIRQAVKKHSTVRERDLARQLGISEAEIVAAFCGQGVQRIEPRVSELLPRFEAMGEVMALTRNESAVHEKIGTYQNVQVSAHAALVLGDEIDLRVFHAHWRHAFAVRREDRKGALRRSLQFFDAAGGAVHKIHLRPESNLAAYQQLIADFLNEDQSPEIIKEESVDKTTASAAQVDKAAFEAQWAGMTDVHQFHGIIRKFGLSRLQAVSLIGENFARRLGSNAIATCLTDAARLELPIMCFVGSPGCIQIHSGPIANLKTVGPWLNVMDPTFHLHLRMNHIAEAWLVRKPNADGHVTSLEAYDADGSLIIQFFGKRKEGQGERADWRALVEGLPHAASSCAA